MAGKVSDGKSVEVTAPVGGVIGGNFYYLEGFLGCAFATRDAGEKVALNIEPGEFETKQILASDTFAKGTKIYWDVDNKRFTETATGNIFAGVVTVAKDSNNVIWFVLAPTSTTLVTATPANVLAAITVADGEDVTETVAITEVADGEDAAGEAPTAAEFDAVVALANDLKAKYNGAVEAIEELQANNDALAELANTLKAQHNALLVNLKAAGLMATE